VLTFGQGLRCSRLKLWDERSNQLVNFREGKASVRAASPRVRPAANAAS
jgi:hypothetical protein